MNLELLLSSVAVSSFITIIGSIITHYIARRTAIKAAREAAAQELNKLERIWQREDTVSSEDEFGEMVVQVSRFIASGGGMYNEDALMAISVIRAKETGDLGAIADKLYTSVLRSDYLNAKKYLDSAIAVKRDSRSSD